MKILPRNTYIRSIFLAVASVFTTGAMAQDIASIGKSDPLIITGAVGTQNTFYWTSQGSGYSSPFSNSVYASMNFNIYGISMPFSFYYTNDNSSFSLPQISFNISPSYKGWRLYLGQHSMSFSHYVYSIPFNGVGIEYHQQQGAGIRFGAFYGTLKKAINIDPDYISVKTPQYKRTGYGMKVGFGSSRNYIDLFVFRAKDHLSSIDETWYDRVNAKENIVVGARGRMSLGSHVSLNANFATSLVSTDLRSRVVEEEAVKNYSNIFDVRYSSLVRWAGDVSMSFAFKRLNTSLSYKIVQPDYTSLGVSYITSNYHSLGISAGTHLGLLSLAGSFNAQADNLSGDQLYTNCGYIYNASVTLPANQYFNITAHYNGYRQTQRNGTLVVTDSTRIDRRMDSYSLAPSFNFGSTLATHNISLSGNYTTNKDLSAMATGVSDVKTLAVGGSYSLTWVPIETTFSGNVSHQRTEGFNTTYNTTIYSLSAGRSFLKSKELSLSASMSLTDNKIKGQNRNLSMGGYLTASYALKQVHQFALSGSCNRYVSNNFLVLDDQTEDAVTTFMCSLSYNYTFTAFHIKHKAEKGAKREYYSDFSRRLRQQQKAKEQQDPNKRY